MNACDRMNLDMNYGEHTFLPILHKSYSLLERDAALLRAPDAARALDAARILDAAHASACARVRCCTRLMRCSYVFVLHSEERAHA